ncbi:MCE family protein [Nocardioides limicola]|uniref:MCE family protein n=1 Tax=Nocardioides limicola TaxID=2803368 RepID=UPI00193AF75C|nr:MlaD family protein [Nocardioides sp. DJM-14]
MRAQIRQRLAIFFVLSLVAVAYTGARYAQLTDKLLSQTYVVEVDLVESGGAFVGAEVTYRGVPVGRVTDVALSDDGVIAELTIRNKWQVPADVRANVHNRSAVGEQYVDLVPARSGPPYLEDGDRISRNQTTIPLAEEDLILTIDRFATGVDIGNLRTVVHELGVAFRGSGGDLQRLLDGASMFVDAANANLPVTLSLLTNTRTVLTTQVAGGSEFQSFSHDLALLTTTLRESDADIRTVLTTGPPAARTLTGLINDLSLVTPAFLENMLAVNAITGDHLHQIAWGLAIAPYDVAAVQAVSRGGRSYLGLSLNVNPAVCQRGYIPPDEWRSTNDLSVVPPPFGLRCAEPGKVWRGTNHAD